MAQDVAKLIGSGTSLEDALEKTDIAVGGGKRDISLIHMVPKSAINNAKAALDDLDR